MLDAPDHLDAVAPLLGWFFAGCCALNVGAAWRAWRRVGAAVQLPPQDVQEIGAAVVLPQHAQDVGAAVVLPPLRRAIHSTAWLLVAGGFGLLSQRAFVGDPVALPEWLKQGINSLLSPMSVFLGSLAALATLFLGRRFFAIPAVACGGLNVSLLFLGLSLADANFAQNVLQPDNLPIVGMIYLLGFVLWWAAAQAVENDRRQAAGVPPTEKDFAEKTFVWPELVYIELICAILVTTLLIVWSLGVHAPLEQPANPALTPNPSKAPWYFVGLQELLVYSDAWLAGVIVPLLIVLGLAAIPYLDRNPAGSGHYTIGRRRFACAVFLGGFLLLWILPILVGTFFRGPNWSFYGLYEARDPQNVTAASNVRLSEWFWTVLLDRGLPQIPPDAAPLVRFGWIVWREIPGAVLLAAYFVALPPLLGRTLLRDLRGQMGRGRYWLTALLLLAMLGLPLKMLLRWCFQLSCVVSMPEYYLNI
jgi:hypothetical protein